MCGETRKETLVLRLFYLQNVDVIKLHMSRCDIVLSYFLFLGGIRVSVPSSSLFLNGFQILVLFYCQILRDVSRSQAATLEVPLPAYLFPPSVVFPVSFTPGFPAHFRVYLHIRVNPHLWVSRTSRPFIAPNLTWFPVHFLVYPHIRVYPHLRVCRTSPLLYRS